MRMFKWIQMIIIRKFRSHFLENWAARKKWQPYFILSEISSSDDSCSRPPLSGNGKDNKNKNRKIIRIDAARTSKKNMRGFHRSKRHCCCCCRTVNLFVFLVVTFFAVAFFFSIFFAYFLVMFLLCGKSFVFAQTIPLIRNARHATWSLPANQVANRSRGISMNAKLSLSAIMVYNNET